MKRNLRMLAGTMLAAVLLVAGPAFGAEGTKFKAQPGSKVVIEGTSTVHDWTMEGQLIGGSIVFGPEVRFEGTKVVSVPEEKVPANVLAIIPVRSLKSGKNSMDEVMQEAMNESKYPRIEYRLKEMKLKEGSKAEEHKIFEATGELTIAGVKKDITMDIVMEPLDDKKLKISGRAPINMTDFGVTPPRPKLALGLIKTGEIVTVVFEWLTVKEGS